VTVIHTCHSHNIPACRKRLDTASRLFTSTCNFDALFDSLIRESLEDIVSKLSQLRYVDPSDGAEVTRVKSDCLVVVRRLHDVIKRMEVRTDMSDGSNDDRQDARTSAFGWMSAAG